MDFLVLEVSIYQKYVITDGIICYHFSIFVRNIAQGMTDYYLAKYSFFLQFDIHVNQCDCYIMFCYSKLSSL